MIFRFSQTLVTHLMKIVNVDANDWDEFIQLVAFAYRINKRTSFKYSLYEVMYGVKPRIPLDLQTASTAALEWDNTVDEAAQEERLKTFVDGLNPIRVEARKDIQEAQQRQKISYDIKHSAPAFQVFIFECPLRIINFGT